MEPFKQIIFILVFSTLSSFLSWILAKKKFLGREIYETDLRKGDVVYVATIFTLFKGSSICIYSVYDGSKYGISEVLPRDKKRLFWCQEQLKQGCYYLWDGKKLTKTEDTNLIAPKE
jgi:regulatory protein YycI of two-component signal transduction system YycFG